MTILKTYNQFFYIPRSTKYFLCKLSMKDMLGFEVDKPYKVLITTLSAV